MRELAFPVRSGGSFPVRSSGTQPEAAGQARESGWRRHNAEPQELRLLEHCGSVSVAPRYGHPFP